MAHIIFLESMSLHEPCAPLKFFAGSAPELGNCRILPHADYRRKEDKKYKIVHLIIGMQ